MGSHTESRPMLQRPIAIPLNFSCEAAMATGVIVLAIANFAVAANSGNELELIQIGPVHVYMFDAITLVLGGAGMIAVIRRLHLTILEFTVLAILLLSTLEFVRSIGLRGLSAGVDFRKDGIVISGVLYFSEIGRRYTRRGLFHLFSIYVLSALLIFVLRAIGILGMSTYVQELSVGSFEHYRLIEPDEALAVLYGGMIALSLTTLKMSTRASKSAYFVVAVALLVTAFLGMIRSVWMAEFVMGVTFPLFCRMLGLIDRTTFRKFVLFGLFLLAGAITVAISSTMIGSAVDEVGKPNGTLMWRLLGWAYLLREFTWSNAILGLGYGSGLGRWVAGSYIVADAHNFFLDEFARLGITGLSAYIFLYGRAALLLYRVARRDADTEHRMVAVTLSVLMVGDFCYQMAYGIWVPSFLLLGYSIGFLRVAAPEYITLMQFIFGGSRAVPTGRSQS